MASFVIGSFFEVDVIFPGNVAIRAFLFAFFFLLFCFVFFQFDLQQVQQLI